MKRMRFIEGAPSDEVSRLNQYQEPSLWLLILMAVGATTALLYMALTSITY